MNNTAKGHVVKAPLNGLLTEAAKGFLFDNAGRRGLTAGIVMVSQPLIEMAQTTNNAKYMDGVNLVVANMDFLAELLLTRVTDSFLTYLTDLLNLMAKVEPRILLRPIEAPGEKQPPAERYTLDDIIEHQTMEELLAAIAERKIESLAYKSMRELASYFEKRLSVKLFEKEDLGKAVLMNAYRNIIVHNRGIVSRKFLKDVPETQHKLGEKIVFKIPVASEYQELTVRWVAEIDRRAVLAHELPQTELTAADKEVIRKYLPDLQ